VASRRLLDLRCEPHSPLSRKHGLPLAPAAGRAAEVAEPHRPRGDLPPDRRHLYSRLLGDAAWRVGLERVRGGLGDRACRDAPQALFPLAAALDLCVALRGDGLDRGGSRRAADPRLPGASASLAARRRSPLYGRCGDLRDAPAESVPPGLRLPRDLPPFSAG